MLLTSPRTGQLSFRHAVCARDAMADAVRRTNAFGDQDLVGWPRLRRGQVEEVHKRLAVPVHEA